MAVIEGLATGGANFKNLKVWTEVLQDSFLDLFDSGNLDFATATSIRFSPEGFQRFYKGWEEYSTEKIGELLGDADAVTVTAKPDGTVDPVMQSVLDITLFKNLKAAKDDHVFPIFGEVTDYESATAYLDTVEEKILKPLQK